MKNKAGKINSILYIMLGMFLLIFIAFFLGIGAMVVDWTFDEAVPEITGIGMVGNSNITEYSEYTIQPVNTVVQNFTWLTGLIYVFGLMGLMGLAFAFRFSGNKWLMVFFIACMLMFIIVSIFMSNIYEEFYDSDGEVGDRLKEQVLLSWLILYSPLVFSIIGFICGVIMFTGEMEEYIL